MNPNVGQDNRIDDRGAPKPRLFLRILLLVVLLGGLLAFFLTGANEYLTYHALREHRLQLLDWVGENAMLAVVSYMLVYIVVVAFSLPGALLLSVAGGFLFGRFLATFLVVVSATVGAVLIFLAARTILGEQLRARAGEKIQLLEEGFRRDAFNYLLILRLVPLFPFFLVNLVPAFLGVPLRTYIAATFLGIIPATFVFTQFGTGLGSILESSEDFDLSTALTADVVFALFGLAVLALVPIIYKRFFGGRENS